MKKMRTEYKLLIIIGIIFTIVLVGYVIKNNYIRKIYDSYQEKKLISCYETKKNKGIKYIEYNCTISDQTGKSYQLSYIEIDSDNKDIKKLNKTLKQNYDKAYKNVEYIKEDKKYKLETYESIQYEINYYNGIASLLIKNKNIKNNILNKVDQYTIYNIDVENDKLLDSDEMKSRLNITRDTSSKLRSKVIEMYATKYSYDYNNEYGIYKNQSINNSVENITYNAIEDVYIDDSGNKKFVLYLYSPNKGESTPYLFTIDKNNNISYKE